MDIKTEINECLGLYQKITEEYPQELNLDELHEVTGRYAKIKEYRDRINEYPQEVQTACEFILTTKCSKEERAKFFACISNNPKAFSIDKKETFVEKRQRMADMAKEIGIETPILFHLVSVAKLKGILGKGDELVEEYRSLLKQYLE